MRTPGSSIEQRERAVCDAIDPTIVDRLLEDGPAEHDVRWPCR